MTEKTPKRPGRKRLSKDGVVMSERVSMSCTPEEVGLLQEAMKLSERDNISSFMRSIIMPTVRNMVTNYKMSKVADQLANQKEFVKMIAAELDNAMSDEEAATLLFGKENIAALKNAAMELEKQKGKEVAVRNDCQ